MLIFAVLRNSSKKRNNILEREYIAVLYDIITEEKVRFGQMILYMNYDRVFNLQSWNAGKSKINYRYNYGFYELFTSRAFSWHFSIWLGHWIFQVYFVKKIGQGLGWVTHRRQYFGLPNFNCPIFLLILRSLAALSCWRTIILTLFFFGKYSSNGFGILD